MSTPANLTGEICNGIAYIDWKRLHSTRPTLDGPLMQCIGRHRSFEVRNISPPEPSSTTSADEVESKYVRSFGSTAILLSPPDTSGRQSARAQTLGPWEGKAVQVGPFEERIVEFINRTKSQGIQKTMVEPAQVLGERSWLVATRSAEMFASAVVPLRNFISKMQSRVPELARETYAIATSIKIEVEFDDVDDGTDDKPKF